MQMTKSILGKGVCPGGGWRLRVKQGSAEQTRLAGGSQPLYVLSLCAK